jgi:hypothetical protein
MIAITETLVELRLIAQRLDVPLTTVQGWTDEGLEHEHWNGRVLTSREALQRFKQAGYEATGQRHVAWLSTLGRAEPNPCF